MYSISWRIISYKMSIHFAIQEKANHIIWKKSIVSTSIKEPVTASNSSFKISFLKFLADMNFIFGCHFRPNLKILLTVDWESSKGFLRVFRLGSSENLSLTVSIFSADLPVIGLPDLPDLPWFRFINCYLFLSTF